MVHGLAPRAHEGQGARGLCGASCNLPCCAAALAGWHPRHPLVVTTPVRTAWLDHDPCTKRPTDRLDQLDTARAICAPLQQGKPGHMSAQPPSAHVGTPFPSPTATHPPLWGCSSSSCSSRPACGAPACPFGPPGRRPGPAHTTHGRLRGGGRGMGARAHTVRWACVRPGEDGSIL